MWALGVIQDSDWRETDDVLGPICPFKRRNTRGWNLPPQENIIYTQELELSAVSIFGENKLSTIAKLK